MALTDDALAGIEAALTAPDADDAWRAFRRRFPGLTLTHCDASDMGIEAPFRRYGRHDLYLVDASDHCWKLTGEPTCATGVVIAAKR